MPYLHYLRSHTGDLMVLYAHLFNWGYGYFSCNAGEHLNKRIKSSEMNDTNIGRDRFKTVIRLFRLKQLEFPKSIKVTKSEVKCSACNQPGHNKKNKSCPLHPSHPPIEFDESDEE